jgi:hypothetical protein
MAITVKVSERVKKSLDSASGNHAHDELAFNEPGYLIHGLPHGVKRREH